MKQIREINDEINKITLKIEQQYPELYQFLGETPVSFSLDEENKIDKKHLSEYLDSLTQLLNHYVKSHQIK
jgi:hypothetical protein